MVHTILPALEKLMWHLTEDSKNDHQCVQTLEEKNLGDFANCGNSYVITPRYSTNHLKTVPN